MYMHKKNYDYLTTEQMEQMLLTKVSGMNISYNYGQGNEKPNYSNLSKYSSNSVAKAAGLLVGMPYLTLAGVLTHVT